MLLAAENGALPRGKVGGVGDVIRDLPSALADAGWHPTVATPGYGVLSKAKGTTSLGTVDLRFGGARRIVKVFSPKGPDARVRHVVFEHGLMAPRGPGRIYHDDGDDRPFATDASRFAFFCAGAASWINRLDEPPGVVHLHDWHAAFYVILRRFDPVFAHLKRVKTVFTIHNMAMQGIRPLAGDRSSLAAWFPDLQYDLASLGDPRYGDCVNPMAAAIRLADKVNTVSPTYAREILKPNDPEHGFHGGEGLESDLRQADEDKRLFGILNGCVYPERSERRPGWERLIDTIIAEVRVWRRQSGGQTSIHDLALERIAALPRRRPASILTSIGRLTVQKAELFLTRVDASRTALDAILDDLGNEGVLILVGSGSPALQERMATIAADHENLLFLCGYSETFTDLVYRAGDLFLMPSSFEPCGISQMLAMRAGQPCVVHSVGGLRDTVRHGVDGFRFDGDTRALQARRFVQAVSAALKIKSTRPGRWQSIRQAAADARFTWESAAADYGKYLYG